MCQYCASEMVKQILADKKTSDQQKYIAGKGQVR